MVSESGLWGLFEYKYSWGLTLKGLLLLLLIISLVVVIIVIKIHPFLAISQPVDAEVLIVEGWANDAILAQALLEFQRGKYTKLITTGTILTKGSFLSSYKNHAELAAATLIKLGCPTDRIIIIPTPEVKVNRTFASANAVGKWFKESSEVIKGVNIYSYDVHTRRSWLVFKKVLQPQIQEVGAIAYITSSYDPASWWTSSEGIKIILTEAIAYLYSLLTGQL